MHCIVPHSLPNIRVLVISWIKRDGHRQNQEQIYGPNFYNDCFRSKLVIRVTPSLSPRNTSQANQTKGELPVFLVANTSWDVIVTLNLRALSNLQQNCLNPTKSYLDIINSFLFGDSEKEILIKIGFYEEITSRLNYYLTMFSHRNRFAGYEISVLILLSIINSQFVELTNEGGFNMEITRENIV
ncbi:hypothetical protein EGR_03399 [Echinococcus granulosus]|uniref:Uncharacterized protein n=1 Tax=Echinococcus granulosus TaxID=6210 RepID=W6ULA6_ECHGR|nr:hypothetical protein EGR_03399 [Echinococcus granulosus]EUB61853.1 hypothetical protein EGR_03399 [Echinococcus granulosus]